ncbi:MAG: thiamine pyrophosphate-binding protein [Nitrososphaerales archaeon]|nr:thiamine pyrophosphate-binding protein [Nitrososphaerales archaeon]
MKGSEVIVHKLVEENVGVVFGIPGVHILPIYDALYDHKEIRLITTRHEQGAAFMADGYARASGNPGVCLLAAGPGATNALTAVSTAYLDSSPLLVLAGGVHTTSVGRGALHEINQLQMFQSITKWSVRVRSFEELSTSLSKAFFIMRSGRPRPVYVELPLDVLFQEGELRSSFKISETKPSAEPMVIKEVANLLLSASRPVIIAGGGVVNGGAHSELLELSEFLQAPVITTIMAKGVFPEDSPLSFGLLRDDDIILPQADVVLALGCRFSERSTKAWSLKLPLNLIQVDIDYTEIGKNYPVKVGIVSDVKEFLSGLLKELKSRGVHFSRREWLDRLITLKKSYRIDEELKLCSEKASIKPQHMMMLLSELIPKNAVVVCDAGNNAIWAERLIKKYTPRTFIEPSGNTTMGFSVPAAIGAKLANRENPVVSICGDGGFIMSCNEIATAVQEELPITIVILNDGGFGAIRHFQKACYKERYIGVDLLNPDFKKLAESFGAIGVTALTLNEFKEAFDIALKADKVTVIDVHIDKEEAPSRPSSFIDKYKP